MKRALITIVVLVVLLAGSMALYKTTFAPEDLTCGLDHPSLDHFKSLDQGQITLGGTKYTVWLANDPVTQHHGLSDTFCLPQGYGMLFAFPTEKIQKFWMKDMNYPIDIVWLDSEKAEVGRVRAADPRGYRADPPEIFSSPQPVKYVLEINPTEQVSAKPSQKKTTHK